MLYQNDLQLPNSHDGKSIILFRQIHLFFYYRVFHLKKLDSTLCFGDFYDILKLSLVLTHSVGWALLLLGKKFDIPAQFDSKEWVF